MTLSHIQICLNKLTGNDKQNAILKAYQTYIPISTSNEVNLASPWRIKYHKNDQFIKKMILQI